MELLTVKEIYSGGATVSVRGVALFFFKKKRDRVWFRIDTRLVGFKGAATMIVNEDQ